ncbi:MAG: ribose-phosphate pyrophosphokinase [Bacillota bacterium]|jgi:ribose-phosphate pyrophosphokinase|nr:ribose-phosphate pyrophosphokinase [Bacillota bacterium]MDD3297732.1 ribose-phosphate pyrophosphokinase [Bacillota bacterium]MDD3850302.1 ribose-phosphate pyrophosphokinase [Bacillota bacterium]MDD4707605.1 ribose-phosphate pyrophosphokinase [Bacillota bacterium]
MAARKTIKLFTGNANLQLAKEISKAIGIPVGKAGVGRFSDGEIAINIEESVRGADVFVIQPVCTPVNDNLMELLIIMDALKRASADRITAVIPYYGYARQDRKSKARDPITAKLVADLISVAGADRILTMDLHAAQIQGYFNIPVDHLLGAPILAEYFMGKDMKDAVVVSPDVGGVARARYFADMMNLPIAIVDKRRPKANVAEVMNVIGDIRNKVVIFIDDIIDTGGSITEAANATQKLGAKNIFACCTHAVFSGPAIKRIEESVIEEMVVLNTIPLAKEKTCDKITVLSVAPIFAEAITRIYEGLSVSKLFDKNQL